jgi:hypothetical protein
LLTKDRAMWRNYSTSSLGFLGLLLAGPAGATEGPTDSYGCHINQAMGTYHCHGGPMAGKNFKSKEQMLQALRELAKERQKQARGQSKP